MILIVFGFLKKGFCFFLLGIVYETKALLYEEYEKLFVSHVSLFQSVSVCGGFSCTLFQFVTQLFRLSTTIHNLYDMCSSYGSPHFPCNMNQHDKVYTGSAKNCRENVERLESNQNVCQH